MLPQCRHCGAAITSRSTLRVAGKMLRPFHTECYGEYSALQPWYRKLGWPVNRWSSVLWFNLLLTGTAFVLHATVAPVPQSRLPGLLLLLLVINAWLLLARVISYLTIECRLPA